MELQYKRPRRKFQTIEEHLNFIKHYQSKEKTELCKNWEAYGWCKFGDKCSFAHGNGELRIPIDTKPTYKSKQCKQFSETGFCNYGPRCLFIHNPLCIDKQKDASYTDTLKTNIEYVKERIIKLNSEKTNDEWDESTIYVNGFTKRRLNVFNRLAEGISIPNDLQK